MRHHTLDVIPGRHTGFAGRAPAATASAAVTTTATPAFVAVGGTVTFRVTVPPAAVANGSVVTIVFDPSLETGTTTLPALPSPDSLTFASADQQHAYSSGRIATFSMTGLPWTGTVTFPFGLPDGATYTLIIPTTVQSVPAGGRRRP